MARGLAYHSGWLMKNTTQPDVHVQQHRPNRIPACWPEPQGQGQREQRSDISQQQKICGGLGRVGQKVTFVDRGPCPGNIVVPSGSQSTFSVISFGCPSAQPRQSSPAHSFTEPPWFHCHTHPLLDAPYRSCMGSSCMHRSRGK